MLGLPQSTEVKRSLPKAQLYRRFDWKPAWRDAFDAEVARLDFVNWIAPRTLPGMAEGAEVKEIFVVEVALKQLTISNDNLLRLVKAIPQRIVWALTFEGKVRLAVWHEHLFVSDWQHAEGMSLQMSGLNLDAVWENIVRVVANVGTSLCDVSNDADANHNQHAQGMSLQAQIIANEQRAKIERQIAALERQMNATKQPRRKRELFIELQKLKDNVH